MNIIDKLSKKIRKVAYKMYSSNNYKVREIKVYIRENYGVVLKESIFTEWFGKKPNHNQYSPITQRRISYLYRKVSNTDKVRLYLNEKYGTEFKSNASLRAYVHRLGLQKETNHMINSNAYISSEEQYKIVKLYKDGLSAYEIFRIYKQTHGYKTAKSITDILKKFGINPWDEYVERCENKKTYKDFSMEIINERHKGYFYGLLLTDGWITTNRNNIAIDLTDEDAVAYCAENIGCSYRPITPREEHHKISYRIFLTSARLKMELINKGVVTNKTLVLSPPPLLEEELSFLPEIFRGIIDGDGWVRKDGKEFYICSASRPFLEWCKKYLEFLGMTDLSVKETDRAHEFYEIRTAVQENILILKNKIYKDEYGMKRKYERVHSDERSETIMRTFGIV